MSPQDRARLVIEAARRNSSLFVDAFFGYDSEPFHRAWHKAWNEPNAHVVQWSAVELGKTQQAIGWNLHGLGANPASERILWVSASQTAAKKATGVIKSAIENPTPFLRACFPKLTPGDPWTDTAFRVSGFNVQEKDNSCETVGIGSQILGGRFTRIVLDDTCTFETTYTADLRRSMIRWVVSTVLGRLLDGGRMLVLGNAWFPDDLMHDLAQRGFTTIRNPLYEEDAAGNTIPESIIWPARFPLERVGANSQAMRADGRTPSRRRELGSVESRRQLRVLPYTSGQGRFDIAWFDRAMRQGANLRFLSEYHGEEGPAFGGLDLGVGEKDGHDASAVWIMAQRPDGKRVVLFADERRLSPPDLVRLVLDLDKRFKPVWYVENNGAQEFFVNDVKTRGIPVHSFTTTKAKADPSIGIPSLALDLEQDSLILPSGDEQALQTMTRWRTQCLDWTPGQHTGDLLMASWFAREACRSLYAGASVAVPAQDVKADYKLRAEYGPARPRLFGR